MGANIRCEQVFCPSTPCTRAGIHLQVALPAVRLAALNRHGPQSPSPPGGATAAIAYRQEDRSPARRAARPRRLRAAAPRTDPADRGHSLNTNPGMQANIVPPRKCQLLQWVIPYKAEACRRGTMGYDTASWQLTQPTNDSADHRKIGKAVPMPISQAAFSMTHPGPPERPGPQSVDLGGQRRRLLDPKAAMRRNEPTR